LWESVGYLFNIVNKVPYYTIIAYYTNTLRGREREKGIKTKMRVKLAAKMMIIAWTLMRKKDFFNPEYLKTDYRDFPFSAREPVYGR
jgi:hypothetical protein